MHICKSYCKKNQWHIFCVDTVYICCGQNKTPTFKTNTATTRPSIAFDTPVSGVPVGVGLYRENYSGNAMVKKVRPFRANTVRPSVRLSVCHTPVFARNAGIEFKRLHISSEIFTIG